MHHITSAQSVYLTLGSTTFFTNNSEIVLTRIGSEDSNTLVCHTDAMTCCRGIHNANGKMGSGQWLLPGGGSVPKDETSSSLSSAFFFTRGLRVLHLMRRSNLMFELGTYCCNIPDRKSNNNLFCANLVGKIITSLNQVLQFNVLYWRRFHLEIIVCVDHVF